MTWRPAFWLVALAAVIVDQASKQWSLNNLVPYEKHEVLGDFLSIQLVFNSGAAFSLGDNFTWVLTAVAAAITIGIIYYARRAQSTLAVWLFGLGLGGAVGNLLDRLFREPGFAEGHVIDMINYNDWFVGNIADIAIVGVAVAVLLLSMRGTQLLAPVASPPADDAQDGESQDNGERG